MQSKRMRFRSGSDFSISTLHEITAQIRTLSVLDSCEIDVSELRFFEPYAMLMLDTSIAASSCKSIKFVNSETSEAFKYAQNMGFFLKPTGLLALFRGPSQRQTSAPPTFLKKAEITRDELSIRAKKTNSSFLQQIDLHSKTISSTLTQSTDSGLQKILEFSVREVIRNVFDHSEAPSITYCAQYWPRKNRVEFAAIDHGIGIFESLKKVSYLYSFKNNHEALLYSIRPGVTSAVDNDENFGYGLFMIREICLKLGGQLLIASGTSSLLAFKTGSNRKMELPFDGTAIKIAFQVEPKFDHDLLISECRREGEKAQLKDTNIRKSQDPGALSLSKYP